MLLHEPLRCSSLSFMKRSESLACVWRFSFLTKAFVSVQASSQSLKTKKALNRSSGGLKKPAEVKRHRKPSVAGDSEEDLSSANSTPRKVSKDMKKRKTEESPSANPAKQESPACVKKPKTARDHSKDLALCRYCSRMSVLNQVLTCYFLPTVFAWKKVLPG